MGVPNVFTIRDFLWLAIVTWLALSWQLDAQVKDLEVADGHDTVSLFREDNAFLEREKAAYVERIRQLEARVSQGALPLSFQR